MRQCEINKIKCRKRVLEVVALRDAGMSHEDACAKLGYRTDVMSRNVRRYLRSLMTPEEAQADIDRWKWKVGK